MKLNNETKIGLLTAFTIALFMIGYAFLKGNDVFATSRKYYVVYDHAEGLAVSKGVFLNGFQVGRITELKLTDHYGVQACLTITSDFPIPAQTVAKITGIDLLGGKVIVLLPSKEKELLKEGEFLIPQIEPSLIESLAPAKNKVDHMLVRTEELLLSLSQLLSPANVRSLSQTTKNMAVLTAHLAKQSETLGHSLENVQAITANLKQNTPQVSGMLSNLNRFSEGLAASNMPHILAQADSAVAQIHALLTEKEGSLGLLLHDKKLYENLASTAASLDSLLNDVQSNPKRYVHFSLFGRGSKP